MRSLQFFCLGILLSLTAIAQSAKPVADQVIVPRLIRFSGQTRGLTGTVGITFTLHKDQQDNSPLWIETQNVQLDAAGKYTVLLGSTKADGIPMELFTSGAAQWLAIRIADQPEQPRVLLVSVPYALKAGEAETLAGHPASDFVTNEKLDNTIKQQIQQQSDQPAAPPKKNPKSAAGPLGALGQTTFSDSDTTEVVDVRQTGTGQAFTATAASNTAITGTSAAATGSTTGVLGQSASTSGIGIRGFASATSGSTVGLFGSAASVSGIAIAATESATSGFTTGLQATVSSANGIGAIIQNKASGKILSGRAGASNAEVFSVDGAGNLKANGTISTTTQLYSTSTSGLPAVFADSNNSTGVAVYGFADLGQGILGVTNDPNSYAGRFKNILQSSPATPGYALAGFTGHGTLSDAQTSGLVGVSAGVFSGPIGVVGANNASDANYSFGVAGVNNQQSGSVIAGFDLGTFGVGIYSDDQVGTSNTYAGFFLGRIYASGTITGAGPVVQTADHPRDPATKILNHAAVVSPEMKNFYDGVITTNADGEALVTLPSYFEDFNRDFRYQLTPIGQFAQAIVSREIQKNQFTIKTDKPNVKVSWLVTGVRNDSFAKSHPLEAETEKPENQRGFYFHPEAYGASKELQIGEERQRKAAAHTF